MSKEILWLSSRSANDNESSGGVLSEDAMPVFSEYGVRHRICGLWLMSVKMLAAAALARVISGERLKSCPADCAENSMAVMAVKNCCSEYKPFLTSREPLNHDVSVIHLSGMVCTHHQYASA